MPRLVPHCRRARGRAGGGNRPEARGGNSCFTGGAFRFNAADPRGDPDTNETELKDVDSGLHREEYFDDMGRIAATPT
jgi:hypothetical protein